MTVMLRTASDAPAPAGRLHPESRARSVRGRLASVVAAIAGLRLYQHRPQAPDAGPAPAQDRPAESLARRFAQRDRATVARRFAAQRDAEATHQIWRSAAVGGGPGLR